MPLDVICPGCRGTFHETTEHFDGKRTAEPRMFRLKSKYRGHGWSTFSPHDYGYGCLECPSCGAPYAPSGHVTVRSQGAPRKTQSTDPDPYVGPSKTTPKKPRAISLEA